MWEHRTSNDTLYDTRVDCYNWTSGDRVRPSAAPRVLLAFRDSPRSPATIAAIASPPPTLAESTVGSIARPPLPPLRYTHEYTATTVVVALIYRRRGGTANSIMFWVESNAHTNLGRVRGVLSHTYIYTHKRLRCMSNMFSIYVNANAIVFHPLPQAEKISPIQHATHRVHNYK